MSKHLLTTEKELLSSFAEKKQLIKAKRAKQTTLEDTKLSLKEKRLELATVKVQQELSHRELLDQEFRAAIALAVERRVEASYRDLLAAIDVTKKHMNVIDNIGQENQDRVIVIPGALFQRDASQIEEQHIEGEVITTKNPKLIQSSSICKAEQPTASSTDLPQSQQPSPKSTGTTTTESNGTQTKK